MSLWREVRGKIRSRCRDAERDHVGEKWDYKKERYEENERGMSERVTRTYMQYVCVISVQTGTVSSFTIRESEHSVHLRLSQTTVMPLTSINIITLYFMRRCCSKYFKTKGIYWSLIRCKFAIRKAKICLFFFLNNKFVSSEFFSASIKSEFYSTNEMMDKQMIR